MRRRLLVLVPLISIGLAALAYGIVQLTNARGFQFFGEITARVETSSPRVALTFDDGPTPGFTEAVLEILAEHEVKATFFLTGREATDNPAQVSAIAGNEIGNHSWSHQRMIMVGPQFVSDEIEKTDAAIRAAGYSGPLHFRPPFGK